MTKKKSREAHEKKEQKKQERKHSADFMLYTPARLKAKFDEFEQTFSIKYVLAALCITVGLALLFCFAFAFQVQYAVVVVAAAIFFAPILLVEILHERHEHRRFEDINGYMQQFTAGMVLNPVIPRIIKDISSTFQDGQMKFTLDHMSRIMADTYDVNKARDDAFDYIENEYPNTQLKMIHDFSRTIGDRGGSFKAEMDMLDKKREKWEKRTEHCQNQMRMTMYSSVLLYVAMVFVCAFVQRSMPDDLSVINTAFSQITEVALIIFLYIFACIVCGHSADGWLQGDQTMSDEQTEATLDYLEHFDVKKERSKGLVAGTISLVVFVAMFLIIRKSYVAVIGAVITIAMYNLHYIIKINRLNRIKKDMRAAVPKWLFDVCLVMQKNNNNVASAIMNSLYSAPAVLRRYIERLVKDLNENAADDSSSFLNFLSEYKIASVAPTMSMLLAIQHGSGGDVAIQMEQLLQHNMNMLDEIDAAETEIRSAATVRYNIYPTVPSTLVMFGYLISMVMKIFQIMSTMI